MSSLQVTSTLLHIKFNRSISGLTFDDMCMEFKRWVPNGNKFPRSFDALKKLMKSLGLNL